MKPAVKWGQGQLFAFSGMEGRTDFENGLCGFLSADRIGISFKLPCKCDLFVSSVSFKSTEYTCVTGDFISVATEDGEISFLFYDAYTVIGTITDKCKISLFDGEAPENKFARLKTSGNKFAFSVAGTEQRALENVNAGLNADFEREKQRKLSFYNSFSYSGRHGALYAKCLSVMKTQICAPEGAVKVTWSTPNRYPHRHAWLWDSCFHAIGFRHIDAELSKDLIKTVFTYQDKDGFIPHTTSPYFKTEITQPPVIAYGALKVYEKSEDRAFLQYIFERNKAFLAWCENNRRKSGRQLYTWHRSNDINCRCDESGMDNSTRFDTKSELFAIDFTCFAANEFRCMAKIADMLDYSAEKAYYTNKYEEIKKDINERLWNERDKMYCDFDIDNNRFHGVESVASFLPLFAGVCPNDKARCLVEALLDEKRFNTKVPIPSLPKGSDYFGDDMWRGPVWINYNYMISEGLDEYGYKSIAEEIRAKTINCVEKYYLQSGTIYEFYDSDDERPPYLLNRKGAVIEPYNPDIRFQAIRDYGWTATLIFDLLNNE